MQADHVAALLLVDEPTPDKLRALIPIDGRPMIDVAVDRAKSWPVDEVIVVLGPAGEHILDRAALEGVTVILEPEAVAGSVSLLRVGLDWLLRGRKATRAVVAPHDLPQLSDTIVAELLDHQEISKLQIVAPKYRYSLDWPIVVDEAVWARLMGLDDDMDIQQMMQAHPELVGEIWVDQVPPTRVAGNADLRAPRRE